MKIKRNYENEKLNCELLDRKISKSWNQKWEALLRAEKFLFNFFSRNRKSCFIRYYSFHYLYYRRKRMSTFLIRLKCQWCKIQNFGTFWREILKTSIESQRILKFLSSWWTENDKFLKIWGNQSFWKVFLLVHTCTANVCFWFCFPLTGWKDSISS